MLQMLQPYLCHSADTHRATDDDKQTYVINARVTPRKGVTCSGAAVRGTEGRRDVGTKVGGKSCGGLAGSSFPSLRPSVPSSLRPSEIAKVSHLSHFILFALNRKMLQLNILQLITSAPKCATLRL